MTCTCIRRSKPITIGQLGILVALGMAACAGVPRPPEVLPTVADSFPAPYDAVWDATVRSLGVVKLLVADKAGGRIETEAFPFNYVVGEAPSRPDGPIRLAALAPHGGFLAQDSSGGGGGVRATQVVWISMHIALNRMGADRTQVQVTPTITTRCSRGSRPGRPITRGRTSSTRSGATWASGDACRTGRPRRLRASPR